MHGAGRPRMLGNNDRPKMRGKAKSKMYDRISSTNQRYLPSGVSATSDF
jgi:hypothetical protein